MIDSKLKAKARLYFETHLDNAKEVAKKFNINYRTFAFWVQNEKWIKGKGLEKIAQTNIKTQLLKTEIGTILDMSKEKIKQNIKDNLSSSNIELEEKEYNDSIDSLSDDLLFSMMNSQFLHTNMIKGALIAKDELLRMRKFRKNDKADERLINAAEKYVSILGNIQKNLYDEKILNKALNLDKVQDYTLLSTDELKLLAFSDDKDECNS